MELESESSAMMTPRTALLSGTWAILLFSTTLSLTRIGFAETAGSFTVLTYNVAGHPVGRYEIAPGLFLDMYNIHTGSGRFEEVISARQIQLRQLDAFIDAFSKDHAVIVMVDTNIFNTRDGDDLSEFLQKADLQDVWVKIVLSGIAPSVGLRFNACAENGMSGFDCEQEDLMFFRSGIGLELVPTTYNVPNIPFADAAGAPLSDHEPVSATFEFCHP